MCKFSQNAFKFAYKLETHIYTLLFTALVPSLNAKPIISCFSHPQFKWTGHTLVSYYLVTKKEVFFPVACICNIVTDYFYEQLKEWSEEKKGYHLSNMHLNYIHFKYA